MSYDTRSYPHVRRGKNCITGGIDMREILKKEIYGQNDDNKAMDTASGYSPRIGFEDCELYFDSIYRDKTSDYSIGELKWQIPPLNNNQSLSNCIETYIGSFFFPKIYSDASGPELLYFRRIYMEILAIPSTQGVLGANGIRFHYEFEVENLTGQSVKLIPIKKPFFFQRPITTLTDFQVRFMIPVMNPLIQSMTKLQLPHDTITVTSLLNGGVGYNPIRFQILGDTSAVLGPVGSLGVPGVAIFVYNYNSNDLTTNANLTSPTGVFATAVLSNNTFEIAGIDATAVTAQYNATIYIPKNRIAFPVRFTSVREQYTNHITIGHC